MSDVHYLMLLGLRRKWRMRIEDFLEEVVQENNNNKKMGWYERRVYTIPEKVGKENFPVAMGVYTQALKYLTQASGGGWMLCQSK